MAGRRRLFDHGGVLLGDLIHLVHGGVDLGQTHRLLSAVVVYDRAEPVWRHVGEVRLTMRDFSDAFLDEYLARNWPEVRDSVGAYKLEEEGVRLFSAVEGDYFTVLGLPLLPLLAWLGLKGYIAS